jgi:hypothetical protein
MAANVSQPVTVMSVKQDIISWMRNARAVLKAVRTVHQTKRVKHVTLDFMPAMIIQTTLFVSHARKVVKNVHQLMYV